MIDNVVAALNSVGRVTEFWGRSGHIYLGFKRVQVENALLLRDIDDRNVRWDEHHDWAASKMYELCVDMRGFFLKAGQFLGMRDDFFPPAYCRILSTLQDRVPPMKFHESRSAIQAELGDKKLEDVFSEILLESTLGSGTIAQVHSGRLRSSNERVAVKIQYPNAEERMRGDLKKLRVLAKFLQNTELKFDIVSAVDELSKNLAREFNFHNEAEHLDKVRQNIQRRRAPRVDIPRPVMELSTKRLLVMSFVEGTPLSQLGLKMKNVSEANRKRATRKILESMSDIYGGMILKDGFFQADPHPGNIIVKKDLSLGIVDFGQCKALTTGEKHGLYSLFRAMHKWDADGTLTAMRELGITTKRLKDPITPPSNTKYSQRPFRAMLPEEKLVHTMFDTATFEGVSNSPFSPDSAIKAVKVEDFPQQLFFVLRSIQIIRGVAHGMKQESFSLCDRWARLGPP